MALEGVALNVASVLVAEGRLVDESTGEAVHWEGFPMVLPVSESLKELVFGSAYEDAVAEAQKDLHFFLTEPQSSATNDRGVES